MKETCLPTYHHYTLWAEHDARHFYHGAWFYMSKVGLLSNFFGIFSLCIMRMSTVVLSGQMWVSLSHLVLLSSMVLIVQEFVVFHWDRQRTSHLGLGKPIFSRECHRKSWRWADGYFCCFAGSHTRRTLWACMHVYERKFAYAHITVFPLILTSSFGYGFSSEWISAVTYAELAHWQCAEAQVVGNLSYALAEHFTEINC